MTPAESRSPSDPVEFRRVLGACPTSVAVVTAATSGPAAMVIGSFGSVSLDPPLVMFMPAKSSSTWPKIEKVGHFAVSILSQYQQEVCDRIVEKRGDHFAVFDWDVSSTSSPILDGCVAWLGCRIEHVHEAGDHWIVVAEVLDLGAAEPLSPPLVFCGGSYQTLAASASEVRDDTAEGASAAHRRDAKR